MSKNYRDISNIGRYTKSTLDKQEKKVTKAMQRKADRIRKYRREASRLASMANKRLQRLEGNQLTDSPAYQKLVGSDGKRPRFGIRGKSYNEVQKEVARMHEFLNSETSTVRGANRVLKEMAKNTGIKYKNLKELRQKAKTFFSLASRIEQYLRTVKDIASAIGYQKIWEVVNKYVKDNSINLADSNHNIEELTARIIDAMEVYDEKEYFYSRAPAGIEVGGWYKLDDED